MAPPPDPPKDSVLQEMWTMLDKHSVFDCPVKAVRRPTSASTSNTAVDDGDVVVLTGTTGRLGTYLLAQLLASRRVRKIYALNRENATPLRERQAQAFRTYNFDVALLDVAAEKLSLLVGDMTRHNLGLPYEVYEEIRQSVTVIISNAWTSTLSVKAPLARFEPLIKGLKNLVHLSLSSPRDSPPLLAFVSTIMVWWNHPPMEAKTEELIADPYVSAHGGYSKSKWVAESLLGRAAKSHGLPVAILRVTQLCGDTRTGSWNIDEWLPALVHLSQLQGVRAVPLYAMKRTSRDAGTLRVLNVVHPIAVPGSVVSTGISAATGLPIIPALVWVDRVRTGPLAANALSRASLYWFEQVLTKPELELHFEIARTMGSSATMRALVEPALNVEEVRGWVEWLTLNRRGTGAIARL
ncbi:male sterility protein-domain-containing protein [Amylostereum chailletii]|nr:male sterility protein-domain-containing protein [Amylostereum chailletii]